MKSQPVFLTGLTLDWLRNVSKSLLIELSIGLLAASETFFLKVDVEGAKSRKKSSNTRVSQIKAMRAAGVALGEPNNVPTAGRDATPLGGKAPPFTKSPVNFLSFWVNKLVNAGVGESLVVLISLKHHSVTSLCSI